jgi:hypothetical protein
MVLLELLGVWLVLMRTGSHCPHAHNKLIFVSPYRLVRVFIDAFTVFPMGTAQLGRPILNIWGQLAQFRILGHLQRHITTERLKYATYTIKLKDHSQYIHISLKHIANKGWMDLLTLASSAGTLLTSKNGKGTVH